MVRLKSDQCCGCSACSNICPEQCIQMLPDEEGFLVPCVDAGKCVDCSLCDKICPAISRVALQEESIPEVYYAYNLNDEQRQLSSSGGVFVLLAHTILAEGGIVYGAALTEDCSSVEHCAVTTLDELNKLLGSKYMQSILTNQFSEIMVYLEEGKYVLFCGTPCQIVGLRKYLQKDYSRLLCVDFVCHGVPSQKAWMKYVHYLEHKCNAKLKFVSFRNKSRGWHNYSFRYIFDNITITNPFDEDLWGKMLIRNNALRESCYQCNFKGRGDADITLADAWGVENSHPDLDDDKGTSLIYIGSPKGKMFLDKISSSMRLYRCNKEEAKLLLPRITAVSSRHPQRSEFYKYIDNYSFDKLVKKYCKPSLRNVVGQIIRKANRLL